MHGQFRIFSLLFLGMLFCDTQVFAAIDRLSDIQIGKFD